MSKAKQLERKQLKADLMMGKTQYIIRHGVIGWGVPTFLLYIPLNLIIHRLFGTSFAESFRSLFPYTILFAVAVFGLAGVYMGNFRWKQLLSKTSSAKKKPKSTKEKKT